MISKKKEVKEQIKKYKDSARMSYALNMGR